MTSLKTAGGYIQEKWKDRGRERGKYKGKRGDTNRLIKIRTFKKRFEKQFGAAEINSSSNSKQDLHMISS